MEPRQLLAGGFAEIQIGAVYYEDDGGEDQGVDRIEIAWKGGAPGTTLTELAIKTDKNLDGAYSNGDVFFDTESGGMGVYGSAPLTIVERAGIDRVEATVADGGMLLVFSFTGFDAGEKLVLTIDVDEQGDDLGGTLAPEDVTNAVAEGGEFQGSRLEATFQAPHYYEAEGWDLFIDKYDPNLKGSGLELPPTNLPLDDYVPSGSPSQRVRTAGSVFALEQTPLPISIAGTVFEDLDLDNRQDAGEPGLDGVTLELQRWVDGGYVSTGRTTVTDTHGDYRFDELLPGTYQVVESQPQPYLSVGASAGTVDGRPLGKVVSPDVIGRIELLGGDDSVDNDFAEAQPVRLSGHVYHDADNDGVMDPGEAGILDVLVRVTDRSTPAGPGSSLDAIEVTTNRDGYWEVSGLYPGDFWVEEVQPDGYLDGLDAPGSAGGVAHNPGDRIDGFRLEGGQSGRNYDFGELVASSISGRVIADANGNGSYDPGDTLLANVTLHLLDGSGKRIRDTTTGDQGEYAFTGLAPGVYGVEEIQPQGYYDGADHVGSEGGKLAPPDSIVAVTLVSGTAATRYDFCELEPASLSGFVYVDDNQNGVRDKGEAGISRAQLELLDKHGTPTGITATTDASGFYRFDDLRPQTTYGVAEVQPAGYYDGLDTAGTAGGTAQNPGDKITGALLPPGAHAENYNFGELEPASISGRVHAELNGDCIPDPGEPLLEGVTIYLLDKWGDRINVTTTDENGQYIFRDLEPGPYGVEEVQPPGYFDGLDHVGSAGGALDGNDRIIGAKLISGTEAVDYNFCEVVPASISGYVFQDGPTIRVSPFSQPPDPADVRDGVRTADDTPIAGVVLRLGDAAGRPILDAQGRPRIAVTDARGFYQFNNLEPGYYTVFEDQPDGYVDAIDTPGSEGGTAINPHQPVNPLVQPLLDQLTVDPNNDAIIGIRLTPGDRAVSYNFSEVVVVDLPYIIPPPPSPPPTPEPPPAVPVIPVSPKAAPPRYVPSPGMELPPMYGGGDAAMIAFTWHLSVVNAGQPRRDDDDQRTAVRDGVEYSAASWTETKMDRSEWVLTDEDSRPVIRFQFGTEGGIPLTGDFNGDGVTEVAVFLDGIWFIDLNGNGVWDEGDLWIKLGAEGDLPITGDWDGDGKTDIGIFGPAWKGDARAIAAEPGLPDADNQWAGRPKNLPPEPQEATVGFRTMRRTVQGELRADLIDHVFQYGSAGDVPLAGDWNGDGVTNIGLFRAGTWFLDADGNGEWSLGDVYIENLGTPGDVPVVGDFNGDGVDDLGIYRSGVWHLDTDGDRTLTALDKIFELGTASDKPIVGDFNGDGVDQIGIYRDAAAPPDQQAARPSENAPGDVVAR